MLKNRLQTIGLLTLTATIPTWACNGSHILGAGGAGAIYTLSAETMKKGDFFLGFNTENINNHTLSDARIIQATKNGGEHIHNVDSTSTYALALSYGMTDDLTLNLNLPYSTRRNIRAGEHAQDDHGHDEYDVHSHGDSRGLGDMSAILQYKFYDQDDIKMAVLAGIKAPTGRTEVNDGDEVLETDLQPGSGAWDLFAGGVISKNFDTFSVHSSMLYKYNTSNDLDVTLGDILAYGVAFSYKLKEAHAHTFNAIEEEHFEYNINVFFELNGEYVQEDSQYGSDIQNTGHHIVYATTGVQLFEESGYSAFAAFSLPLYQDLNGVQNEAQYRFSLGLGKSF